MINTTVKNQLGALTASPLHLLRKLNRSLQVGCMLALATVSQCNYTGTPSSNVTEEECCVPVENMEDCPCIVIIDVGEGK